MQRYRPSIYNSRLESKDPCYFHIILNSFLSIFPERVSKSGLMLYIRKSHAYIHRGYHYVPHFPTGDTRLSREYLRANRILRHPHITGSFES